ncbi:hypothetical protein GCM10017771_88630 [Streptomyces capitiformicae]|uniref:Uncharacterized protein n=1 Tax=Streptomyces capitiformicae TaxID=2014920 RepID=A0A919DP36_9ACTN|nr:hypothetical protein GCM10017771_88630 [Streptomyces capitiformicae]
MPSHAGPSAGIIVGTVAAVGFEVCAVALPCPCPDMAVAGAAWVPDITMPGVITCAAGEEGGPIATAADSW